MSSIEASAPDEVTRRFISSYGVRTSLMEFFDARVFAQFQMLSKQFYDKRVSEVQTRLVLRDRRPFLFGYSTLSADYYGYYDLTTQKLQKHVCEVNPHRYI